MTYPSYLVHFNRQHDPKTGKFTYGDGDGDGVRNDHKNQKTKGYSRREDGTDGRNSSSERNRRSETAADRAHNDRYSSGGGGRISGTSVSKPGGFNGSSDRSFTREHTGRITTAGDKVTLNRSTGNRTFEVRPRGNTYRFKDTTGKETVYRPEREIFKERDVISGKQTTIGSDRYNSIKPRLNRDFTREGTGKTVRVGDTTVKVSNFVKGKRQKNPNGDKPGEQSDGTKSKDTYVKLPGQPISRVKNTYEKIPDGPYKPKYKKVQTQLTSKDEEMSTEEKYNTHRLNAVSNFIDDVINSDEDENKKPRTKKPTSNSEKVSAEENGRKFVLKTIDRMLNKLT